MLGPNPFDAILVVELPEGMVFPIDMIVRDAAKQIMLNDRIFTTKKIINTVSLTSGLYHIELINERGLIFDGHFRK